ncbi:response regulator [Spirosoma koreense]
MRHSSDQDPAFQRDLSVQSFYRQLARYRAQVYETYFPKETDYPTDWHQPTPLQESILVVEDNVDEWFLTRWALLQRYPQAEMVWLSTSEEVMPYLHSCHQAEKELPKLILLDLYLPQAEHGIDVLKSVKAHPDYRPIPLIILSRSSAQEDMADCFQHASTAYLVKPTTYMGWLEQFTQLDQYWQGHSTK